MSLRRRRRGPAVPRRGAGGWSLVEVSAALAVAGLALVASLPALAGTLRRHRLEAAARTVAQALVAARWDALASGRVSGLRLLPETGGDLVWQHVRDGDGDGLRTDDLDAGIDPQVGRPHRLSLRAPGVRAGVLGGLAVPRLPPQTGLLDNPGDPVKFGAADLVSFSPVGSATSGSLYFTDGAGMTALVLNGNTGRLRLFRFDTSVLRWKEIS